MYRAAVGKDIQMPVEYKIHMNSTGQPFHIYFVILVFINTFWSVDTN